jgi:hypothetical protein
MYKRLAHWTFGRGILIAQYQTRFDVLTDKPAMSANRPSPTRTGDTLDPSPKGRGPRDTPHAHG